MKRSRNESEYRRVQRTGAKNQLGLPLSPLEDRRSDCLLHDLFKLSAAVSQSGNTTSSLAPFDNAANCFASSSSTTPIIRRLQSG